MNLIIAVPANILALNGARPSADAVMNTDIDTILETFHLLLDVFSLEKNYSKCSATHREISQQVKFSHAKIASRTMLLILIFRFVRYVDVYRHMYGIINDNSIAICVQFWSDKLHISGSLIMNWMYFIPPICKLYKHQYRLLRRINLNENNVWTFTFAGLRIFIV